MAYYLLTVLEQDGGVEVQRLVKDLFRSRVRRLLTWVGCGGRDPLWCCWKRRCRRAWRPRVYGAKLGWPSNCKHGYPVDGKLSRCFVAVVPDEKMHFTERSIIITPPLHTHTHTHVVVFRLISCQ